MLEDVELYLVEISEPILEETYFKNEMDFYNTINDLEYFYFNQHDFKNLILNDCKKMFKEVTVKRTMHIHNTNVIDKYYVEQVY